MSALMRMSRGRVARVGDIVGGRFVLEQVLGSGGLATVFGAKNVAGGRVAIKMLRPELQDEPRAVERFIAEAYIASRVDHPSAVRVLEASARAAQPFLVMELLLGDTLEARLARRPVALWQLLSWIDQVLDVLALAHARGVVHRDVKPSNIFITVNDRVKLLDFGVALLQNDVSPRVRTQLGMALGSLPYMAPEQTLGRRAEIDGRTDVFGVGATLFRAISGRTVRQGQSFGEILVAAATQPVPPLGSVTRGIPEPVQALVDGALAFDKNARWPGASSMQYQLRCVMHHAFGSTPWAAGA